MDGITTVEAGSYDLVSYFRASVNQSLILWLALFRWLPKTA